MSEEQKPVESTEGNLPVPAPQFNIVPPEEDLANTYTTFPLTTEDGKLSLYRARNFAIANTEWDWAKPFPVANVLYHPAESVDEKTGEVSVYPRTVLVSPDGTAIQFGSMGVYSCIRGILAIYKDRPLNPPILVQLRQRRAKKVGNIFLLDVVGRGNGEQS